MDLTDDMTHARLQRLHADLENKAAKLSAMREEIKRLHSCVAKAESERDDARRFGEDAAQQYNELLRASQTVTCAFCGQEYPRGTPRHGDGALSDHITVCPKHPMRAVERDRDVLKAEITQIRGIDTPWPLCDVLLVLQVAVAHLRNDHDCDCEGHEVRAVVAQEAERYESMLRKRVAGCT